MGSHSRLPLLRARLPDTDLQVYAPRDFRHSLEAALAGQMQYPYFPVTLAELRSRLHYTELAEGGLEVGNVRVDTHYLNHTAPALAYRLSCGGATIAYVTDHEPFWPPMERGLHHPGDQRHIAFLQGADLIIHDAQYTREEYRGKVGWGHSPIEYATDVAVAAGAARLALFHHDPGHDDRLMQGIEAAAPERVVARGGALEVFAAVEGQAFQVRGRGPTPPVAQASALPRRALAGRRVLLVSADARQAAAIARVLGEDGLVLTCVPDKHSALAQVPIMPPDVVIIDQRLPDGTGTSLIRALRAQVGRGQLPVLLLTGGAAGAVGAGDSLSAATDYLSQPCACRCCARACAPGWRAHSPRRP